MISHTGLKNDIINSGDSMLGAIIGDLAGSTDEYFEFTDPAFIKYLKQSYFIIDYDRFDKMSYDEIAKKLNENTKNIEKLQKQIKKINRRLINPKLKKQEAKPLEEAGALLMYYQESMIGFVEEKFVNSKKK